MYDTKIETPIHERILGSGGFCFGYNDISSYLDKKMTMSKKKIFENHMAFCPECRADIIELRQMIKEIF